MATIEPRLIHLLNGSTPQLSHADLPPLHALPFPQTSDRSLPPLDPDASHRGERHGADSLAAATGPSSASHANEETFPSHRNDDGRRDGRYAGSAAAYPLRLLLGESDTFESPHSFGKILDDTSDLLDDGTTKKRTRSRNVKDDFVQLPQPVKKQKATQQAPAMPPIINGLHEPPPHAALFPPIASNSFDENDANQMKALHDFNHGSEDKTSQHSSSEADKSATKGRKRATKPRRKWSEEETNHLLLGVNRHGEGKWTSILEDPAFTFNDRTAGDLKDRFRTCCPDELRRSSKNAKADSSRSMPTKAPKQKARKGIHSENILIEDEELSPRETLSTSQNESDSAPKQKKSRAHRKKMEDLAELGICGPFKKSRRRERRPFTEQDDREILEGLDQYGPAWTKIQRDSRFHLTSRQPTDLRDRVRNKYPNVFQRIEKGTFQPRDDSRSNDILEPSVNMSINNSLQRPKAPELDPQISHRNSREDLPRWPLQTMECADNNQPSQAFEFGEASNTQFMGGEMDISRLLLDDTRFGQGSGRNGADGRTGSRSPPGHSSDRRRDRNTGYSVRC